ncbi:MarR family transcriptional regulator [Herbiconiux sp.]|uniref:MarR family winged helix-turn-helix transcriptional regulator n=1 Tax=Herbiconiux sp. TaxID=1871186 RepID=UPI0025C0A264|nr:MarR family transcriptional regulator [Herbiconiux sp.]
MEEIANDRVDEIQSEWRRERPDLDVSPQGLIGRLHRVAAALTGELVPVYTRHGLSEGEFDVLATLRRAGAPYERAPGELAAHTMVTTGAMTKRIDRLVEAGLVLRESGAGDGRRRVVSLTERGRDVIDAAFEEHMANEHRLAALLGAEDRAALEPVLRRWLRALDG